jgi:Zn-dependent protease with chaperone function
MARRRRSATERVAEFYGSLGTAADERLMTAFTSPDEPPSGFSPAFLVAWVMAAAVLVFELLIPVLGIYALVHLGIRVGSVLIAALCLFVFWVTRPRLTAPGDPDERDDVPGLRALVDPVAAAMNVKVARVRLSPEFNASVGLEGISRRPAMDLGVPLLASLRSEERVALVAHECGHLVNRDPTRTLLMGAALETLIAWFDVLLPRPHLRSRTVFLQDLADLLLRMAASFVRGYAIVMLHPLMYASRRAELYADMRSSEIAGTPAAVAALEKLEPMGGAYGFLLELALLHPDRRGRLAEELSDRRIAFEGGNRPPGRSVKSDLLLSHPPTELRTRVLSTRNDAAQVRLSASHARDLDEFLATKLGEVERYEVSRSATAS